MKEINHENVLHFMGAAYDHNMRFVLVWSHTGRRSLENLLFDEEMQLNLMFKASIIRDLVKVNSLVLKLIIELTKFSKYNRSIMVSY